MCKPNYNDSCCRAPVRLILDRTKIAVFCCPVSLRLRDRAEENADDNLSDSKGTWKLFGSVSGFWDCSVNVRCRYSLQACFHLPNRSSGRQSGISILSLVSASCPRHLRVKFHLRDRQTKNKRTCPLSQFVFLSVYLLDGVRYYTHCHVAVKHGSVTMTIESSTNTCAQPDTKSNLNLNPNPNPTTKQHAIVNIQLNIVTCATYPDKFIRDTLLFCLYQFFRL